MLVVLNNLILICGYAALPTRHVPGTNKIYLLQDQPVG